jgi:hypothetical protein
MDATGWRKACSQLPVTSRPSGTCISSGCSNEDLRLFTGPPGVSLTFLQDLRPGRVKSGPGQRVLSKVPSRLLHWPGSPPVKGSSLLTDVLLSQWLQALTSDILVTTRSELHVAAAQLAPPEVRLVAQEHVHYFQRSEPVRRRVEEQIDRIDALAVLTERDRHDYTEESPGHRARSRSSPTPSSARSARS